MNLNIKNTAKSETIGKISVFVILMVAELFLLITAIGSFAVNPVKDAMLELLLCLVVAGMLVCPWLLESWWGIKMPPMLKLAFMLLAVGGPILGKIYKFYYRFKIWDKLLHTASGFLFAAIGGMLPAVLDSQHNKHSLGIRLVSAFCFTLAVAVVWEFFEFAMDNMFGMDMQQDTVINDVNSYLLGHERGVLASISQIDSVMVNGKELAINGYLDIGIIDTMKDMLVCTVGGLVYCVCTAMCERSVKSFAWVKGLLPSIHVTESAVCAASEQSLG